MMVMGLPQQLMTIAGVTNAAMMREAALISDDNCITVRCNDDDVTTTKTR